MGLFIYLKKINVWARQTAGYPFTLKALLEVITGFSYVVMKLEKMICWWLLTIEIAYL